MECYRFDIFDEETFLPDDQFSTREYAASRCMFNGKYRKWYTRPRSRAIFRVQRVGVYASYLKGRLSSLRRRRLESPRFGLPPVIQRISRNLSNSLIRSSDTFTEVFESGTFRLRASRGVVATGIANESETRIE